MIFEPALTLPLQNKDILSWIFDGLPERYDQDRPVYIDVAKPSRTISARQARTMIRQLVAGFRKLGVKPGTCVCM